LPVTYSGVTGIIFNHSDNGGLRMAISLVRRLHWANALGLLLKQKKDRPSATAVAQPAT